MANTTVVTTSKKFSLGSSDFIKGLIVAVFGAVAGLITSSIQAGNLSFDWKTIGLTALSAGLAYLTKNFFDTPKVVVSSLPPETVQAIKDGDKEVKILNT